MPVTFTKEIESRVINRKLTKGAIYSIRKGGQPVGRIIRYWAKDLEFPYRTGYTVQELQVDWSHEGQNFWKDTEFFVKNSKFGPKEREMRIGLVLPRLNLINLEGKVLILLMRMSSKSFKKFKIP